MDTIKWVRGFLAIFMGIVDRVVLAWEWLKEGMQALRRQTRQYSERPPQWLIEKLWAEEEGADWEFGLWVSRTWIYEFPGDFLEELKNLQEAAPRAVGVARALLVAAAVVFAAGLIRLGASPIAALLPLASVLLIVGVFSLPTKAEKMALGSLHMLAFFMAGKRGSKKELSANWSDQTLTLEADGTIPTQSTNKARWVVNSVGLAGKFLHNLFDRAPEWLPLEGEDLVKTLRGELRSAMKDGNAVRNTAVPIFHKLTSGLEMLLIKTFDGEQLLGRLVFGAVFGFAIGSVFGDPNLRWGTVVGVGLLHFYLEGHKLYPTKPENIVLRLVGLPALVLSIAGFAFERSTWLPLGLGLIALLAGWSHDRKAEGWKPWVGLGLLVLAVLWASLSLQAHAGQLLLLAAHVALTGYFIAEELAGRYQLPKLTQAVGVLVGAICFSALAFMAEPPKMTARTPEQLAAQAQTIPARVLQALGISQPGAQTPEQIQKSLEDEAGVILNVGEKWIQADGKVALAGLKVESVVIEGAKPASGSYSKGKYYFPKEMLEKGKYRVSIKASFDVANVELLQDGKTSPATFEYAGEVIRLDVVVTRK